jgi:hypothetical protein
MAYADRDEDAMTELLEAAEGGAAYGEVVEIMRHALSEECDFGETLGEAAEDGALFSVQ